MCQGTARERLAVCDHHVHVKEKVGWVFLFVTVSALEGFGAGGGTEVYICFAYLSHCFLLCFTYMLLQFNDF